MVKKKVKTNHSSKRSSKTKIKNIKTNNKKSKKTIKSKTNNAPKPKPLKKIHHIKINHKPKEKIHHKGILVYIALIIVILLAVFLLVKFGGVLVGKAYEPVFESNDAGTVTVDGKGITVFQKDNANGLEKYYIFSSDVTDEGMPLKVGKCKKYDPWCNKVGEKNMVCDDVCKVPCSTDDDCDTTCTEGYCDLAVSEVGIPCTSNQTCYDYLCDDGLDADGDFDIDCDDIECYAECLPTQEQCIDENDNDADGKINCEDTDCFDYPYCQITNNNNECTNNGEDDFDCDKPGCGCFEEITFEGLDFSTIDFKAIAANEDVMIAVGNGILYCNDAGCSSAVLEDYTVNDIQIIDDHAYIVGTSTITGNYIFYGFPLNFDSAGELINGFDKLISDDINSGLLNALTRYGNIIYAVGDNGLVLKYDIYTEELTDLLDPNEDDINDFVDKNFIDIKYIGGSIFNIVVEDGGLVRLNQATDYVFVYPSDTINVFGVDTNFPSSNSKPFNDFNMNGLHINNNIIWYGDYDNHPAIVSNVNNNYNVIFQDFDFEGSINSVINVNGKYRYYVGSNGLILTEDYTHTPSTWNKMYVNPEFVTDINDIAQYGAYLYVVGNGGKILRHNPMTWGDDHE